MSIPPDSQWRGAAAFFRQPLSEDDEHTAQCMITAVDHFNTRSSDSAGIQYRSSDGELDILRHVFRFDRTPYHSVFQNGFEARRQAGTPDQLYFNLEYYVNSGGRPLDTRRQTTHIFVSTTLSNSWYPSVSPNQRDIVYRYEIYAPGGIWVAQSLGERYHHPAQDEVAFIAGISPQYIRSAQQFELTNDRHTRRRRVNDILYINRNFNPQSHPQRQLQIQNPVRFYMDQNGQRRDLITQLIPESHSHLRKRSDDVLIEYYTEGVTNVVSYIDSAFRSTRKNEVYIFVKDKYVLMNYAPGSTNDRIVNGPLYIGDGFPSLAGTAFAEYGIDAAFGCTHRHDEAMIFSGNLCARINYAPGTTDDWIVEGIKTIKQMFPFFQGTNFERGIDAAFETTEFGQAYLFKGSEYALIDYYKRTLIAIRPITVGFHCLRNTGFEGDIGAAFASHIWNEAYLFKGNSYILLHFTPGENRDYIVGGPKEIVPRNWPSLNAILPRRNVGLDVNVFPQGNPQPAERNRDEL